MAIDLRDDERLVLSHLADAYFRCARCGKDVAAQLLTDPRHLPPSKEANE